MITNTDLASYLEDGAAALASGELTWVQGFMGGGVYACALGACNYARTGSVQAYNYDNDYLIAAQSAALDAGSTSISTYNDVPGRTVDEVISLLTSLAKGLRNEGA